MSGLERELGRRESVRQCEGEDRKGEREEEQILTPWWKVDEWLAEGSVGLGEWAGL